MTLARKLNRIMPLLLLPAAISLAMQLETGSIEGVIMSGTGPIAQASLEARNEMSGAVFRTESDAAGHYKLENIRAGRYSLWMRSPGHDSVWIPKIVVEPGETTHYDIHLGESHTGIQSD